jgi:tripartite-type tricarboxylate transporter receptor subunit TctC
MKIAAGIDLVHVPYKGGAPALQDVLSGRVPLFTDVLYSSMPYIKSGKLKVLALMSPRRVASSPEYPVIAETLPGVSATSMVGIVVPGATPRELVQRISRDIAREIRHSELTRQLEELGTEPVGSSPEEYDARIREEIDKWARVVREAKVTVD